MGRKLGKIKNTNTDILEALLETQIYFGRPKELGAGNNSTLGKNEHFKAIGSCDRAPRNYAHNVVCRPWKWAPKKLSTKNGQLQFSRKFDGFAEKKKQRRNYELS